MIDPYRNFKPRLEGTGYGAGIDVQGILYITGNNHEYYYYSGDGHPNFGVRDGNGCSRSIKPETNL